MRYVISRYEFGDLPALPPPADGDSAPLAGRSRETKKEKKQGMEKKQGTEKEKEKEKSAPDKTTGSADPAAIAAADAASVWAQMPRMDPANEEELAIVRGETHRAHAQMGRRL